MMSRAVAWLIQYWTSERLGAPARPIASTSLACSAVGILGAQRLHRIDAQPADDRQEVVHARDLEQRALVRELEQALGADAGFLGQPLAVDAERCAVEKLVGVLDPARAQPP